MATTQPRIFTFSKGGGSKGDKSMKELVSALFPLFPLACCLLLCALPCMHACMHLPHSCKQTSPAQQLTTHTALLCACYTPQLGGKGANLCEMAKCGVNIPPGLTITTEVCEEFYRVGE